jgi:hypothetical protein
VKARVIADHCKPLTPEQIQDLQDLVLPGVADLTTSELRDAAGQAVIIVDPDGAENRHQEAAARRELRMQPGPDGMATLKANLPADGAVKIFQVSDLLATGTAGTPGDSRGIGARRVDALVDIADHLLTHGFIDLTDYLGEELPDHGIPTPRTHTSTSTSTDTAAPAAAEPGDTADPTDAATDEPNSGAADAEAGTDAAAQRSSTRRGGIRVFTRQGRRPHLSVTLGLSTLAGLDNLPGSLAGFGAIPAGLARSIAASAATINTVITDPDTERSPPPEP